MKKTLFAACALVLAVFVIEIAARLIGRAIQWDEPYRAVVQNILSGFAILACYRITSRHFLLPTQSSEVFNLKGLATFLGSTVVGFSKAALAILALAIVGIGFHRIMHVEDVVNTLAWAFGISVLEEVLFRGLLLQLLARYLPPLWAALIVGVIFAFSHFDGRGLTSILATFVGAGLAYSVAFLLFRTLWVPIGLHMGSDLVTILASGGPGVAIGYLKSPATQIQFDITSLLANSLLLAAILSAYIWSVYFKQDVTTLR